MNTITSFIKINIWILLLLLSEKLQIIMKHPNLVPGSFPEEFSTGYLLGELLHKYGLQDDFKQFSQNRLVHMNNIWSPV